MAASVTWAVTIIPTSNTINNIAGLAFGKLVAGSGGTVTVSPGGGRSPSGGVVLVPSDTGAAAQFVVSGDANLTYAITLPFNGVVLLINGANMMAVNNFTSSPNLTGTLSAGGTQMLLVGATLSVANNQAAGGYLGVFYVVVNYN